jgi:hypothetical protein
MYTADLAKGMQLLGPRRSEEAVPSVGSNPHDAGEPTIRCPEPDAAHQRGQNGAETSHGSLWLAVCADGYDQEDGGTSKPSIDGLGTRRDILRGSGGHAGLLGGLIIDHHTIYR